MERQFEGIVLFVKPYRERDMLAKIATPDYGNLMFFIKGGQSTRHPLAAQLLPYSHNVYIGTLNKSGFSFLKEGQSIFLPKNLQVDLLLQAYATYFSQLVDGAKMLEAPAFGPLFDLYRQCLVKLDQGFEPAYLSQILELKMLHYYGVDFDWDHCLVCKSIKSPQDFSIGLGGVLCPDHYHQDPYRLNLLPKTLSLVKLYLKSPLDRIQSLSLSPSLVEEGDRLIGDIYDHYVGYLPKSKAYIKSLLDQDKAFQALLEKRNPTS
ncbi:TPA: DNA repair protein RecO [Streptococcus suis]